MELLHMYMHYMHLHKHVNMHRHVHTHTTEFSKNPEGCTSAIEGLPSGYNILLMISPSEGCVTPETIFVKGLSLMSGFSPSLPLNKFLQRWKKIKYNLYTVRSPFLGNLRWNKLDVWRPHYGNHAVGWFHFHPPPPPF